MPQKPLRLRLESAALVASVGIVCVVLLNWFARLTGCSAALRIALDTVMSLDVTVMRLAALLGVPRPLLRGTR